MKKDPLGGLSAHRTSSTRFSKMQAFSRWEAACCSALAALARLQAEKTKFRGACPRNFGNLTLFRRLRTAKLCRGLFPMQEIVIFLQGAILFRQTERPSRGSFLLAGAAKYLEKIFKDSIIYLIIKTKRRCRR